jgi:hypothetical protein
MGRFTTRDVWEGDANAPMSYNAWLYVYGNPINAVDPSGMQCDGPNCPQPRPNTPPRPVGTPSPQDGLRGLILRGIICDPVTGVFFPIDLGRYIKTNSYGFIDIEHFESGFGRAQEILDHLIKWRDTTFPLKADINILHLEVNYQVTYPIPDDELLHVAAGIHQNFEFRVEQAQLDLPHNSAFSIEDFPRIF